jgi:ankyrin repeat protein
MGGDMKEIPESAFPNPIVHEAAEAVVNGTNHEAIRRAAEAGLIDYVSPDGETLLTLAVLVNRPREAKVLLDLSANPELPAGKSPLALAARGEATDLVELLLQSGANPNSTIDGEPAVVAAARVGNTAIVQSLLRRGADLERANSSGNTALIASAKLGHYQLALDLVSAGASPFAHDLKGWTAAAWATEDRLIEGSPTARKRDALLEAMRSKGYPWPQPSPEEVLLAEGTGKWPPN